MLAPEFEQHGIGGAELQQTLLAKALVRRGFQVSMVVGDYGQPDGAIWSGVRAYKASKPWEGIPVLRFVHPRWTKLVAALRRAAADVYYVSPSGVQVGQVALGAIAEADRHNIRGERISVDTIPLVGEEQLADAVRAVARLHRARALVLAGAIMGGDITKAVREIRDAGILVLCTSMAGSVPDAADVVVSDPVEAGVMAVMLIADTAKFSIEHVRGKRF